ncbi:MAG: Histidine biosynthesis protein [Candidatus Methanolliviera sp. GoM_oil]|nr:MAG: Histidine biosynthesis protein [Candidatus Methanolliviera sp. GoM_oil]
MDLEFLEELRGMSVHSMIFGGGIRGLEDLDRLKDIGMDGALVATAVYNGKIPLDLLR